MNVYINYILYIGAIFCLLLYLVGKYRNKFSKKYFSLLIVILFTYIIGVLIALLRGFHLDRPLDLIYVDLFKSTAFPLSLVFAGLISKIQKIKRVEKLFLLLCIIFSIIIFIDKTFRLTPLGNIIKASTVQLYNLSFIGFWGLYLLSKNRYKKIARFIILLSWLTAIFSLTKWNFFPILILPLLWIIIETQKRKRKTKKQIITAIILIIILASMGFIFRNNIVYFSSEGQYETWHSYWQTRVVAGDLLESGHVRSSGRFKIWNDLLQQFSKSPLVGIGFGARPTFKSVPDHNMFIFFLTRFGFLLSTVMIIFSFMLIIHILKFKYINKINRLILFSLIFYYFFFSASIGSSWSQLINGLTVGIIIGFIIHPRNNDILKRYKQK